MPKKRTTLALARSPRTKRNNLLHAFRGSGKGASGRNSGYAYKSGYKRGKK